MILTKVKTSKIDIDELVNQKLKEGSADEILFIVPTNRKVRNLKRELIKLSPNSSAKKIKVETLSTFSSKMLRVSKNYNQISEATSIVFIKQAASAVALSYFSVYRDGIPHGTLEQIRNVILEYKRHGISPQNLLSEVDNIEGLEKSKALDIVNIYTEYKNKCDKLNAFDIGDIYSGTNKLTINQFENNFNVLFGKIDSIIVDGFSEFSNPEIQILNMLSNCAAMFISFDYSTQNDFIFSHLEKCFGGLQQCGFNIIEDNRNFELSDFHNILRAEIFNFKRGKKKTEYLDKIAKLKASTKEKEVELIAKQIKLILKEKKCEPNEICVVFNLIQEYSSLVKDLFTKYGIPYNLTDRTPLDNSSPIISIISFLEVIESDYYFKNIFRVINSGYINIGDIDYTNLYAIASELKIISGKENWLLTIDDALANLKNSGDEDDISYKKKGFEKAKEDLTQLIKLLNPFEQKLTINTFEEALNNLIIELKIPYNILTNGKEQESNSRALNQFLDMVKELFFLLKDEHGEHRKFSPAFFLEHLRTACGWARYNIKEKSNYGVLITNLEEIRGLKFKILFIGGLVEGILPTRFSPQIFYSGSFKKHTFTHQTEERFLFYRALNSFTSKMFLSYHLTNNNRETVKSYFLKEFDSLFNTPEFIETDFNKTIFSNEELQIEAGRNKLENMLNNFNEFTQDNISEAVRIETTRKNNPFGDSAFTGKVTASDDTTNKELDEVIIKYFDDLGKKQYSISQLENYAKCPYKFFVERVLNIGVIEEPTEDIEAIEMGRLLHSILFDFYTLLKRKNLVLQKCSDNVFENAKIIMLNVASNNLKSTAFKSPMTFYEKEKILGINGNFEDSLLYRFLIEERNSNEDFIPKYFEVGFGKVINEDIIDELNSAEPILVDGIKLRGKIDRIDIDEKNKMFNVVDYKLSGSKPSFKDLKEGISLQLPIYLYAASELLSKKFNKKYSPSEMFIYSLKYSQEYFGKDKVGLGRNKDQRFNSIEELIENSLERIKIFIDSISQGKFNLSMLEDRESKVCNYCNFKLICRIDEVK